MVTQVITGSIQGIEALSVGVEVDLSGGLPGLCIVGLPDAIVNESKERLRAALRNAGFELPNKKIIINLAPASLRKEGTGLDLPLAIGILGSIGQLNLETENPFYTQTAWLGELALDGSIRPVPGVLALAVMAKEMGLTRLVVPKACLKEASLVEGLEAYGLEHLNQVTALLEAPQAFASPFKAAELLQEARSQEALQGIADFADIKGQAHAKRALEIAAAGGHNVLMVGPPGSGKSLLARALVGLLPPLGLQEAVEVSRIYSVANMLPPEQGLLVQRPFRSPHHSASMAGLTGGGSFPKPGEITLAHRGVLFLDELVEFPRPVLEILRQPLEDGAITISRAQQRHDFPARCMVVAAMNPCPCGYRGDTVTPCVCRSLQIERYVSRLSGPLLDRLDLHLEVPRLNHSELLKPLATEQEKPEASTIVRERVIAARALQQERFKNTPLQTNAELDPKTLEEHCPLNDASRHLFEKAIDKLGLSARGVARLRRVARTIADLEGAPTVSTNHVAEALQYRGLKLATTASSPVVFA